MKSTVENLSPTRVRLAVEVPFAELKASLDKAYRSIAGQVRVPGFRPGKVPARIIDQRVGRAAVLEEAVNDAIPTQYSAAVREHDVKVLGQPSVDVTEFADGELLKFTAEVDVRPKVVLPAYDSLAVTVDDAAVDDDEIDGQLTGLRDRFAVLQSVDRPVRTGDFVSIDLLATVGGEELEGGSTTGLSYEVGSGDVMPGLDEALIGMGPAEAKTFQTALVAGDRAGETADVVVTVRSVKEKELPALDDDFAQTASEFDTLAELRDDMRERMTRVKRLRQGMQARDKVLETLLGAGDVPLPDSVVTAETDLRRKAMEHQLGEAGLTVEDYLNAQGRSGSDIDLELRSAAEAAVKAQLVLDAVADAEQVGVSDAELTDEAVGRAQRAGMAPEEYVAQLVRAGQIPALAADVRRNKALALVLSQSTVTDASGRVVDLQALGEDGSVGSVRDDAPAPAGDAG